MIRCRLCGSTDYLAHRHQHACPGWWEQVPEPTNWLLILLMSVGIVLGVVLFVALVTLL